MVDRLLINERMDNRHEWVSNSCGSAAGHVFVCADGTRHSWPTGREIVSRHFSGAIRWTRSTRFILLKGRLRGRSPPFVRSFYYKKYTMGMTDGLSLLLDALSLRSHY